VSWRCAVGTCDATGGHVQGGTSVRTHLDPSRQGSEKLAKRVLIQVTYQPPRHVLLCTLCGSLSCSAHLASTTYRKTLKRTTQTAPRQGRNETSLKASNARVSSRRGLRTKTHLVGTGGSSSPGARQACQTTRKPCLTEALSSRPIGRTRTQFQTFWRLHASHVAGFLHRDHRREMHLAVETPHTATTRFREVCVRWSRV
jgi:hypothetical protein